MSNWGVPPKSHKIDLQQSYPCPLCRGKLQPITLTDAVGCDRCHLIFVAEEDGYTMMQVGVNARSWYWCGKQWNLSDRKLKENQHFAEFTFIRLILILCVVILLCLLTKTPEFLLGFTLIVLLLAISWRFLQRNF
jgi:hypothetical protein